uniref:Adenylate kinase n=1 Tax=Acrobeloides nanus TaxID=290746 RepID=A0A914BUA2_9BILA
MVPGHQRVPSVTKAADVALIAPDAPIILFMGGPGGGKTKYAAKIREALEDRGLVHICMPDLVKNAVAKYKDRYPEWRDAAEKYQRGELIPNHLAQDLVKAEMGRYPYAKAYFLEGFPREARQVEDFERNVRPVNMALILDYDEDTLRRHMQNRGLSADVIDRRIHEFKQKTLPSAKYFDDQRLLHLIPGEKDDQVIIDRMKKLVLRAIDLGVPITNSNPPSAAETPIEEAAPPAIHVRNGASRTPNGTKPPTAQSNRSNGSAKSNKSNGSVKGTLSTHKSAENRMNIPSIGSAIPPTPYSGQSPVSSRAQSASTGHVKTPDESEAIEAANEGGGTPTPPKTPSGSVAHSHEAETNSSSPVHSAPRSRPATNASRASRISGRSVQKTPSVASQREDDIMGHRGSIPNDENATPRASPEAIHEEAHVSHAEEVAQTYTSTSVADIFPKGLPANAPVILIIGAPGSHKSELAEMISKKYDGFIHLSMGELLRRKVIENPDDELWTRVGRKMDSGDVVPTKICREILYTTLHEVGSQSWGYILEGYPRTLEQAEEFENQLGRLDLALLVDCTEQFCRDSLAKRLRDARVTGTTERLDDETELVTTRLETFKQNTLPMLKHLDDKGKLRVVRIGHSERRCFKILADYLKTPMDVL